MKLASRGGRDAGSIAVSHKGTKSFPGLSLCLRVNFVSLFELLSVPFRRVVLRQRLDDEVESEPQTPTVMIKKHRKDQRHCEQQHQHMTVVRPNNQQEEKADHQDHELRRDHVREDGAHEKPVFTLEQRQTMRAVVPDMKRVGRDRRLPTRRTTQSQRTPQYPLDIFQIYFQGMNPILREAGLNGKP